MIKNPKLMCKIGVKKPNDIPEMYDNPKLFPRQKGGAKYEKAVEEVPDPQFEDLHPTSEEKKQVAKAEPDTEGKLEGKFKVSLKEMIKQLNSIVEAEYSQWMRYYHYAMVLKGHCRDALAGEFEIHAEEELEHLGRVALRVIGLGGYPSTAMEHPKPLSGAEEILKELLRREQEGIELYRKVLAMCGDNEGTRQILEGNIEKEQDHIDELWRYLKNPDMIKATSAGRTTNPSEKQAKREYDHSFARFPRGVSGSSTPDKPERGRDWHGTVPGVPDEPQGDEEEKDQEEAQKYFKATKEAIKSLAMIPRFVEKPILPPKATEFMNKQGYSSEDIDELGGVPRRLQSRFCQDVAKSIRSSLTRLSPYRG